jgi:hypothetical protein
MKRLIPVVSAVAFVAAVAIATSSSGAQQGNPRAVPSGTVRFVEREGSMTNIDGGPKGTSVGDSVVFSRPLLARSDNKRIGTLRVVCVTTQPKTFTIECHGTYFLPGGTIEAQAGLKDERSPTLHIAVVGGTGKYAGARGAIASVSRKGSASLIDDTITLMP